jgi:hypothetical protein
MIGSNRAWGAVLVGVVVITSVVAGTAALDRSPAESSSERERLRVADVEGPKSVETSGSLTVSATVVNPAQSGQTRTVALKLDRDGDGSFETTVERRRIEFEGGEQRRVDFTQPTERLRNGSYEYGVFVDGGNATAAGTVTVEVSRSPRFRLSGLSTPVEVVRGNVATISLDVTNAPDEERTRSVTLLVDADGDGSFESNESVDTALVELEPEGSERVSLSLPTSELPPGTHAFRVETETDATTGTVTVLRPATFDVEFTSAPENVTRGERVNLSLSVTNAGDVAGTKTLEIRDRDGNRTVNETITLEPGAETTVATDFATENASNENRSYVAEVSSANDTATVHVDAPRFEVSRLRSARAWKSGAVRWVQVEARVVNTGDVGGTESVELRMDLNGDDEPERVGLNRSLRLDVGESETVEFEVLTEVADGNDPVTIPVGTHIYGVFTRETDETDVVAVEVESGGSGGGSGNDGGESTRYATLDEITQSKYGKDFDEVSGETKTQVRELYTRQPFANDLAVTEVLTREEFAREKYGVDIEGRSFEFSALDVELQQQIEADFDAQFTSDDGDRVESWNELARRLYGAGYESLTEERQREVREQYRAQFE